MIKHGFVNYYDEKYDNLQMLLDIMYSTSNIAFWKRKNMPINLNIDFCLREIHKMIL